MILHRPWVIAQRWHHLLFAHWPIDPSVLRSLIPENLALDTFEGNAWVGVVPFEIQGFHPRGLPFSISFAELNVRTYVTAQGKPGVWFFSLDAASPLAVFGARRFYHLPYFNARMALVLRADTVDYTSERTHVQAEPATFNGIYRPVGDVFQARAGSLEHWLTERYCLYAARGSHVYRGDIHHTPWPLQPAEAEIRVNTMALASGIHLPETAPLLHYAHRLDVITWLLRSIN